MGPLYRRGTTWLSHSIEDERHRDWWAVQRKRNWLKNTEELRIAMFEEVNLL
jgi:hypothetical protein